MQKTAHPRDDRDHPPRAVERPAWLRAEDDPRAFDDSVEAVVSNDDSFWILAPPR